MAKVDLTAARLRELIHYEPDTGLFTWLPRPAHIGFKLQGMLAGNVSPQGYVKISVQKRLYAAHRLAFLYMLDRWPADRVDHINGVRGDNRWCNIRESDPQLNSQNLKKAPAHNVSSGLLGATLDPGTGLWRSQIMHNGRNHFIGLFSTPGDAHNAYIGVKRVIHAANTL